MVEENNKANSDHNCANCTTYNLPVSEPRKRAQNATLFNFNLLLKTHTSRRPKCEKARYYFIEGSSHVLSFTKFSRANTTVNVVTKMYKEKIDSFQVFAISF